MKRIIAILLIINVSIAIAQDGKIKRANEDFENYAFMDAIDSYEHLIKEGYDGEKIFKKLGNSNYVNARYESAAEWYCKLVQIENTNIELDYLYRYAQSLKSIGNYRESDLWMKKFNSKKSNDQRAKNFTEHENYLERIKKNSGRYSLKNLDINSPVSDFAPSFYGKELVFSTARDTGIISKNINEWDNGSFLNLHSAMVMEDGQLAQAKKFTKNLNTKTHESSSVFTKDGNTIYFTRNNSKNGKFGRDGKGISRLKIFKASFKDGQWKKAVELPFNSDNYSVAHPALGNDDKTLYFSSDMPGSLGASDIFKVAINEDGNYGVPENLGKNINTEARESFPFVKDQVLYFSSDGHPGLGGFDVFAAKLDNTDNQVINLGEPLNSRQDDFSYIIDSSGKGYFSSNRDGGMGNDDIYAFTENTPLRFECISELNGVITDKETGIPLPMAKAIVMSGQEVISETRTDDNGVFEMEIDCIKENYTLVGQKEDYLSSSVEFEVEKGKSAQVKLSLEKPEVPAAQKVAVGANLVKHLQLEPIYFDLDKSNIRLDAQLTLDRVADYLNEYLEVRISIESYTDVKASNIYNQRLSERRAKATFAYLVSKGVGSDRLQSKGFGEKNLANDCTIWNNCSFSENELNRRSELIVVKGN